MKLYFHHSFLSILSEGKIENLKLKYPKFEKEIDELSLRDTTSSKKTLDCAIKWLMSGQAEVNEIGDVIELFNKLNSRLEKEERDIDQWKSFNELRNRLFELNKVKSKTAQKIDAKNIGSDKVYEDEQVILIHIKNKNASCAYGAGTKWCITMQDAIYYEDYDAKNVIFLFLLRKDLDQKNPLYKVAIVFQRDFDNKIKKLSFFDAINKEYHSTKEPFENIKNINQILNIANNIAKKAPKSILAKYFSNEISLDEVPEHQKTEEFWNFVLENKKDAKFPIDILEKFINSKNIDIRSSISQNTNLSKNILEKLSNDSLLVRRYCARNTNLPISILEKLSNDRDEVVRMNISTNLSTPNYILEKLSNDKDEFVRMCASKILTKKLSI